MSTNQTDNSDLQVSDFRPPARRRFGRVKALGILLTILACVGVLVSGGVISIRYMISGNLPW